MKKFLIFLAAIAFLVNGYAQTPKKGGIQQRSKGSLVEYGTPMETKKLPEADVKKLEAEKKAADKKLSAKKQIGRAVVKTDCKRNPEPGETKPVQVNGNQSANAIIRGASSPLIYSTPTTDPVKGVFSTTLGAYNQSGTQLATISVSYQAMEMVDDVIYVVRYSSGNSFGTVDRYTGAYTSIATSGVPDAISMAWNVLTGDVYCTTWGDNAGTAKFGKINLTNGSFTQISGTCNNMFITIDNDGVCYALDMVTDKFGTLNLTNGAFSEIITYSENINYIQDLFYDRETDELYHLCRIHNGGSTSLRKVNKSTGVETVLGNLPRNAESVVLFSYTANLGAPAAVTGLTVTPGASGAMNANITWTNPTLTFGGAALTEITDVKVYEGTNLLTTLTGQTPGGSGSYAVNPVATAGNHTYKVIVSNAAGEGAAASATAWIGEDVPAAVGNPLLVRNDMMAEVSWTAPTAGLHSGYFTGAGIVYDVFRMPSNLQVATSQTGTTFSETVTTAGSVSYKIVAKNASGEGGAATTNVINYCATISSFPWTEDFSSPDIPACWEFVSNGDVDEDAPWEINEGYAVHGYGYGDIDDWLITPPINMTSAGYLTFQHASSWASYNVYTGIMISEGSNDPASGDFVEAHVFSQSELSTSWHAYTYPLGAYTGKTIYIAFRYMGDDADIWGIDDVTVDLYPVNPVIAVTPNPLAAGTIFNNLPVPNAKAITITNSGVNPLTITGIAGSSSELSLSGSMPFDVNGGTALQTTVLIDASSLPAGPYSGTLKIESNDPATPVYTIPVTGTVASATILNPCDEHWSESTQPGWTYERFARQGTGGVDNSACVRANVYGSYPDATATTPVTVMGAIPALHFGFRAAKWQTSDAVGANDLKMKVEVSSDFGATWTTVYEIPQGTHSFTPASYETIEVPAADMLPFAGGFCVARVTVNRLAGDDDVYIDDFFMGTPPIDELQALAVTGPASGPLGELVEHTVKIRNNGSATQTVYTVKLMQVDAGGDIELGSLPGVEIAYQETKDFVFSWTPGAMGMTNIYGVLEFVGDEFTGNNTTSNFSFRVTSASIYNLCVGEGTTTYNVPINFYWRKTMSQTVYLASEIGVEVGAIQAITYKPYLVSGDLITAGKHVAVFLKEVSETDMTGGWVDPATMTKVFDGQMAFTSPTADVTLSFNIAYFEYHGGNLAVYMYAFDGAYFSSSDKFVCTAGANRTRYVYGDSGGEWNYMVPGSVGTGSIVNGYPDVCFEFDMAGTGKLKGTVTDDVTLNPLQGVTVMATSATVSYTRTTNATGDYSFNYLKPDNYIITATKFGYYDYDGSLTPVAVIADAIAIEDFAMTELPTVHVSGTVTGNDTGGTGLPGVEVTLSGYGTHTAISESDGTYEITGVYADHEYTLTATKDGYTKYTHPTPVDVLSVDYTGLDFMMDEILFPVKQVTAAKNGNDIDVLWTVPVTVTGVEIILDVVDQYPGSGTGVWGDSSGYQLLLDETHTAYGTTISPSAFLIGDCSASPTLYDVFSHKIPAGAEPVCATPEIVISGEQSIMIPEGTYDYCLVNPTPPDAWGNQGLYYPGGTQSRGNDYTFEEGKTYRFQATYAGNGDNVTLYVTDSKKPVIKAATGDYKVYRFLKGTEETSWGAAVATVNGAITWTDANAWNDLPWGVYNYAVKVEYTGGSLSNAKISNDVPVRMLVPVTVNLSTNTGDAVSGATIKLTNVNGNSEYVYTTPEGGVGATYMFPNVWRGEYTISVKLKGFDTFTNGGATYMLTSDDNTIPVVLTESCLPVSKVTATPQGSGIVGVTWTAPGAYEEKTYIFDDGSDEDGLSINPNFDRWLGNKFVVGEAGEITSVNIFFVENSSSTGKPMYVEIFDASQQSVGVSESFVPVVGWFNVPLNNVPYSGTFYAMLHWTNTGGYTHYLGEDKNGPHATENLDMRYDGSAWSVCHTYYGDSPYVFMLRVNANATGGKGISYGRNDSKVLQIAGNEFALNEVTFANSEGTRQATEVTEPVVIKRETKAVSKYELYRFPIALEGTPASWTEISTDLPATQLSYNDNVSSLPSGSYKYAVKVNYGATTGISEAKISNAVDVGMDAALTVTLTTNSGDPLTGAVVNLNCTSEPEYTYTYTMLSGDNGVHIFNPVRKGTYTVTVTKAGFTPVTATGVSVMNDVNAWSTELVEIIEVPYGLEVEPANCSATFSWNHVYFTPFSDDIESYTNFIIANIGNYTLIDLDGAPTFGIGGTTSAYANWATPKSFMVFNPSAASLGTYTVPTPHNGNKLLMTFSSDNSGYWQDDWLILPKMKVANGVEFSFWAKSYNTNNGEYNLERFKVGVSTTTPTPAAFTFIQPGSYVEPPEAAWTKYSYDVSAYAGQEVYLAIECVSVDSWSLMVDDISVDFATKDESRSFLGYNVYLNGVKQNSSPLSSTSYNFSDLATGSYTAGVSRVYSSAESATVTMPFDVTCGGANDYTLKFIVTKEGTSVPVQGASITVMVGTNPVTLTTDNQGSATTTVPNGTYPYTVSKLGYDVKSGSVTVSGADKTENVSLVPIPYNVTFTVKNTNGVVVSGAAITIGQDAPVLTNAQGTATVQKVNGTYTYSVTKDGYVPQTGMLFTVEDGDCTVPQVTLEAQAAGTYYVTFNITNQNGVPLTGAVLTFDNVVQSGWTVSNLVDGSYSYKVTYSDAWNNLVKEGTATVAGDNQIIDVTFTVGIKDNVLSSIVLYPNPFMNEINISNSSIVKSVQMVNASGQRVKQIVFNGKSITTGELNSGVYFITVESITGEKVVYKMVKK